MGFCIVGLIWCLVGPFCVMVDGRRVSAT